MDIIDILIALVCIALIVIALLLACALWIVRRGTALSPSPRAVADDPFFFPFGEMPTVPRERLMVARDFRAWGLPDRVSPSAAVAHRRKGSGGRPASTPGTAVVLTFKSRRA